MPARQSTCVLLGERGILIEGPPGSGKSSLALALIDRGARLVGDDSILLEAGKRGLVARPHPGTTGLIEIRNLGLVRMEPASSARICLVLAFDSEAPRFIEAPETVTLEGIAVPLIRLTPESSNLALKAEIALERFGLGDGPGNWV